MSDKPSLKDLILQKAKEGKVVFMTYDGPLEADLDEFIKQPAQGLLYDLNRDPVTVMSFLDDPKWVNDYAVGLVIGKLKEKTDEAKMELERLIEEAAKFLGTDREYWSVGCIEAALHYAYFLQKEVERFQSVCGDCKTKPKM